MQREKLEFVCKDNGYLAGGTKEACVKARDFIKNVINHGNDLCSPLSCVSANEFVESVKILTAYAFDKEDVVPEFYKCDNDCRKVSHLLCPGECSVTSDAKKMCPFFEDEANI